MEIILKEDVVNLGYKNDIVTVKSGYGRNYLIPTGKAVIASPSAKKMLAEELKQRAHKLEKIKKDAEAMAEQLKDVTLTIATKVSATEEPAIKEASLFGFPMKDGQQKEYGP